MNWSGLRKLFTRTAAAARIGAPLVQQRAQAEIVIPDRPAALTYDFLPWIVPQEKLPP
ncbi:MAG TPA: hypothetical protein VGY66_20185 [Gemmataceae bacterium]|nr:hypothetical protein [Gemmataceae bacterium]